MDGKNSNNFTTTVRVRLNTYHKLEELVRDKKMKNLKETGKVGDADFDGIITDLLNKNGNKDYQPKHEGKMETSLEGDEERESQGGDMHGNRKEEKIQNMDETGGRMDEKQLS